jgi:tetratricopeptide (TPR) repeat protein
MAIAKAYQVNGQHDLAIANFKSVVSLNKAALAAEARYEIANSWFALNKLTDAEKSAFEVINKSGSYDFWVTNLISFLAMFISGKKIISMQRQLIKALLIIRSCLNLKKKHRRN